MKIIYSLVEKLYILLSLFSELRERKNMTDKTLKTLKDYVNSPSGKYLVDLLHRNTYDYPHETFTTDNEDWCRAYSETWCPLWNTKNENVDPVYKEYREVFFSLIEKISENTEIDEAELMNFQDALQNLKSVHMEEALKYGFDLDDPIIRKLRGSPHLWCELFC
jgi:hypothetical protein